MSCALVALLLGALAWAPQAGANTIAAGDVQVGESGDATFTLTRTAGFLSGSTSVAFRTVEGSAGSPADFTAASGTLTFGSLPFGGSASKQVSVAIRGDALNEASETFRLAISGSEVVDPEAVATIVDDDPLPSLSVADSAAVAEGAPGARASFVVRLSVPSGRGVSVAYTTANGSATAGQDYTARAGTLVLAAGSTQAAVDVGVLDDGADEPAETFDLQLASPGFATLGDAVATATIVDDDNPLPALPPPASQPGATTGSGQPSASPQPGPGATAPGSGTSAARQTLGVSSPRLKRPSTALVTISCPQSAGRCSGRVTLFSVANKRSRLKALRKERKLGRATFSLQGGRAQTLSLVLGRADLALLRRTGRMRVRAYAVTQDSAGRTGVRTVSGTLIARTAHSSPSSR